MSEKRNNDLLFRVRTQDGHVYEIFTTGKTAGFPPGSVVFNLYPHQARLAATKDVEAAQ